MRITQAAVMKFQAGEAQYESREVKIGRLEQGSAHDACSAATDTGRGHDERKEISAHRQEVCEG